MSRIEAYLLGHVENTTFTASLIVSTNELLGNNLDKNCGRRNDEKPPSEGYPVFQD
jgi:hypothetical protein